MIEGWVQLEGSDKEQKITLDIPELKVKKEVTTDANGYASFLIKSKPILWTPENPKLYAVNLASETDKVSDENRVSARFARRASRYLLNDKEIFCRGISSRRNSYYSGRAYSKDHAHIAELGKGTGMQLCSPWPIIPIMKRWCARPNVWASLYGPEISVYWTIHWENKDTYQNAEQQFVRHDCPLQSSSWSIANETPHSERRLTFPLIGLKQKQEASIASA